MITRCPACGQRFLVSDSAAGKKARCTNSSCGMIFVVEPADESPASRTPTKEHRPVTRPVRRRSGPASLQAKHAGMRASRRPGWESLASDRQELSGPFQSFVNEVESSPAADEQDPFAQTLFSEAGITLPPTGPVAAPTGSGVAAGFDPRATSYYRPRRRKRNLFRYGIGVAVVLVLITVVITVSLFFGGRRLPIGGASELPEWARWAVLDEFDAICHIDYDACETDGQQELLKAAMGTDSSSSLWGEELARYPSQAISARFEGLAAELYAFHKRDGEYIVAIRTKRDMETEEFVKSVFGEDAELTRVEGVLQEVYYKDPICVTRITKQVFCCATDKDLIGKAVEAWSSQDYRPLDRDFAKHLKKCEGQFAIVGRVSHSSVPIDWITLSLAVQDDSVKMQGWIDFTNSSDARKLSSELNRARSEAQRYLRISGDTLPEEKRRVLKVLMDTDVRVWGKTVYMTLELEKDEFLTLLQAGVLRDF